MKPYLFCLSILSMLLFSGCFFSTEPFRRVTHYDLGTPPVSNEQPVPLKIGSFTCAGPYKYSMVYRINGYELFNDDFNKWALTPEKLLNLYLISAFGDITGSVNDVPTLKFSVLTFEADFKEGKAILAVSYSIEKGKNASLKVLSGGIKTYAEELKTKDAAGFAAAQSANAAKFAKDLTDELNKISKN